MEYIYKFIEYINESNLLKIGLLIFVILYLVYLYVKKCEEKENYLEVKLIGFYLLGAFTFNFNDFSFIIPVGFAIYLIFMSRKQRTNNIIKKKACIMGLIIVCFGWVNTMIYNAVEYRDREITIKNLSVKSLRNDYEMIKKELGIDDTVSVESLDLEYKENNKIRSLSYTIQDLNNKTYYITTDKDGYTINTTKTYDSEDESFMFGSLGDNSYNMYIETLLDTISNIKFKEYKNASYYLALYRNGEDYYEKDENLYTVDLVNFSTKRLDLEYPICDAVDIIHMPMKQVSEGSWESMQPDIYLMSYEIDDQSE